MICVSLSEASPEKCIRLLKGIEFAEIRLERFDGDIEDIWEIFSQHSNLIATCRPGPRNNLERKDFLLAAIKAGAAYVDIEVESHEFFKRELTLEAKSHGCKVIISFHDFEKTRDRAELEHIVSWCFDSGADIAKIACKVYSTKDNARILGLLSDERPLVVVGMGEKGKITRIIGPYLGSQFTYASLDDGKETGDGQISISRLTKILESLKNV
jgi:3-dehydroquinate dehydratase-1